MLFGVCFVSVSCRKLETAVTSHMSSDETREPGSPWWCVLFDFVYRCEQKTLHLLQASCPDRSSYVLFLCACVSEDGEQTSSTHALRKAQLTVIAANRDTRCKISQPDQLQSRMFSSEDSRQIHEVAPS